LNSSNDIEMDLSSFVGPTTQVVALFQQKLAALASESHDATLGELLVGGKNKRMFVHTNDKARLRDNAVAEAERKPTMITTALHDGSGVAIPKRNGAPYNVHDSSFNTALWRSRRARTSTTKAHVADNVAVIANTMTRLRP